jgi:intein/homing endonuclease
MKLTLPEGISVELAEETGWHIGDGSMNYYKNKGLYQLRGHIEDDKPHYIQRVKPIFKFLYGIDVSLRKMPSTRVFGFQIWSDDFVKFKNNLGLPLGEKLEIGIPKVFLKNKELKIAVVRGIFDTDGCVYLEKKNHKLYPRMEITTISSVLANQLLIIFISLDFRATVHKMKGIGNRKDYYKVVIRGDKMFHRFIDLVNPTNPKHIAKYERYKKALNSGFLEFR